MTSSLRIVSVDPLAPQMRELFLAQLPGTTFRFESPEPSELREVIAGAFALVTRRRLVDRELMESAGAELRLIQVQGRLPYRVDLDAARQAGIMVATMPSRGAVAVAQHTLALMLALARRIVSGHRGCTKGAYRNRGLTPRRTSETEIAFNWLQFPDVIELGHKTLGVIGFGEIGQEVARLARAFEMPVIYHQRNPIPASYEELLGARSVSLSALLRESDWLSLHAPHTPATEGMIDRNAFLAMKPNAFIINTARGGLIDEPALVDCLRERRIAGAGLDVFVEEPLPADHPLSRLENVVLSPHLGGGAGGGHRRHVSDLLENVARVARGEEPQHRVA